MPSRTYYYTPVHRASLAAFHPPSALGVGRLVGMWTEEGKAPAFHRRQQAVVRRVMPVLAYTLDYAAGTVQPPDHYGEIVD